MIAFLNEETEKLEKGGVHRSKDLIDRVKRLATDPSTFEFWDTWKAKGEDAVQAVRAADRASRAVEIAQRSDQVIGTKFRKPMTSAQWKERHGRLATKSKDLVEFLRENLCDYHVWIETLEELAEFAEAEAQRQVVITVTQPRRGNFKVATFMKVLEMELKKRGRAISSQYKPRPTHIAALTNAYMGLKGTHLEVSPKDVSEHLRPDRRRVSEGKQK